MTCRMHTRVINGSLFGVIVFLKSKIFLFKPRILFLRNPQQELLSSFSVVPATGKEDELWPFSRYFLPSLETMNMAFWYLCTQELTRPQLCEAHPGCLRFKAAACAVLLLLLYY